MYTAYFGFRENPFNVTPDPHFFYANQAYEEAYATLQYGLRERKGLIVLTGEVGTGKTTLLRRLMDELLAKSSPFVFFYNTTLSFADLLSVTCTELGLTMTGEGLLPGIQVLNQFLITQLEKGGTAVLLIDEAQNLQEDVLENLRLLSNLETAREKLLQIVLVGQPELEHKLALPSLRQLRQRIALRYRLDRLKETEIWPFIRFRLRTAGCERNDLFTLEAIRRISFYSQGIPRLINIICDNTLLIAYASSRQTVSAAMVDEVAVDLQLKQQGYPPADKTAVYTYNPTTVGSTNRQSGEDNGETNTGKPQPSAGIFELGPVVGAAHPTTDEKIWTKHEQQTVRTPRYDSDSSPSVASWYLSRSVAAILLVGVLGVGWWMITVGPPQTNAFIARLFSQVEDFIAAATQPLSERDTKSWPASVSPANAQQEQMGVASPEAFLGAALEQERQKLAGVDKAVSQPQSAAQRDAPPVVVAPRTKNAVVTESRQPAVTIVQQESQLPVTKPSRESVKPIQTERMDRQHSAVLAKIDDTAQVLTSPSPLPPVPIPPGVAPGQYITVRSGFTMHLLAGEVYKDRLYTLGMDLLKEFNPHVETIDRVFAGQQLWIPPLTSETLVRMQPDGSYHLIIGSFRDMEEAEWEAQVVAAAKGYAAIVVPRQVSQRLRLHRVEVVGIESLKQARRACDLFKVCSTP